MRDAVHGEGVKPDFFFHDGGNCCIPAGFSKPKFERCKPTSGGRRIPIGCLDLALGKEDMTRTDTIARARQQLHSRESLADPDRRIASPTERTTSAHSESVTPYAC